MVLAASSSTAVEEGASVQGTQPATAKEQTENSTTSPNEPKKYPFVLCLRGLNGWNTSDDRVCVLSQSVADQLKSLLTLWKKLKTLVETDLVLQGPRFGTEYSDVMKTATHPLVDTLLVDQWKNVDAKKRSHMCLRFLRQAMRPSNIRRVKRVPNGRGGARIKWQARMLTKKTMRAKSQKEAGEVAWALKVGSDLECCELERIKPRSLAEVSSSACSVPKSIGFSLCDMLIPCS